MKTKISIAIPEPLNQQLRKRAKKDGMSLSALISHALMNYMKEQANEA